MTTNDTTLATLVTQAGLNPEELAVYSRVPYNTVVSHLRGNTSLRVVNALAYAETLAPRLNRSEQDVLMQIALNVRETQDAK